MRSQVRGLSRPQKQTILLENQAKMPNTRHVAKTQNDLPEDQGGDFCLIRFGVAIKIDSTQGLAIEAGRSSASQPVRDSRPKCPLATLAGF